MKPCTSRLPLRRRVVVASALLSLAVASGCEYLAPPHLSWTEARVVGRVVDADTRQPVAGAQVTRVLIIAPGAGGYADSNKGGPAMAVRPTMAVSDRDGRFTLEAVKTAYLILDNFPDYAMTLRVRSSGYLTFQRDFTNVTYAGGDKKTVPIVEAGDVEMRRATAGR